jgi:hypothetical protein
MVIKKWIIAVLFFALFSHGGGANAVEIEHRATWLWNPWMLVKDEAGTLSFLENKKINKVYLQIDRDIPMSVYQSFIEKAAKLEMKVYALDGAPNWITVKGQVNMDQLFSWLNNYQAQATSIQKFTGIHLDVEPYLTSSWSNNQAAAVKNYQNLLVKANTHSKELQLQLEADIPFWFDEIVYKNTYGKGVLAEWVIANTNGVTIMAYRDTASAIIEIVQKEIALSEKYQKPLVIGVETGQTEEGEQITFYEEGEAYMNAELEKVTSFYKGKPGFHGIAIHHVGSWQMMNP